MRPLGEGGGSVRSTASRWLAAAAALAGAGVALAAETSAAAPDAARGARTFARTCAACHGREGKGDGPGALDLDPRPRDLTSTQVRFRTTPSGSAPLPADLERTLRHGLPGSAMPAFGELFSRQELDDLIAFVLSLSHGAQAAPLELPALPAQTPESVALGRGLYQLMGCPSCHGTHGAGDGPAAAALTDEGGLPIRATNLAHDPLKGGRTAEAVARTLLTGLNGAPMPSYAEALLFAREDVSDLSSFADTLRQAELDELARVVSTCATRTELDALDERGRTALRDQRLAALAHYVISLDRRRKLGFRLFGQRPEQEPRLP